jgi:hypothetical protein
MIGAAAMLVVGLVVAGIVYFSGRSGESTSAEQLEQVAVDYVTAVGARDCDRQVELTSDAMLRQLETTRGEEVAYCRETYGDLSTATTVVESTRVISRDDDTAEVEISVTWVPDDPGEEPGSLATVITLLWEDGEWRVLLANS